MSDDPAKDVFMSETETHRMVRIASLACAAVVVKTRSGDQSIGTAFHVGEGVYVTARHVVEGNEILEFITDTSGHLFESEVKVLSKSTGSLSGETPIRHLRHASPLLIEGVYFHPNEKIDVAAIKLSGLDQNTPYLILGGHYDDWINDNQWLLTKGTAFGFPPIPFTKRQIFVGASIEINAVVDTRIDRYVRFVVSGPPRGGFSGGPVCHEWGFVLGMIIDSLEWRDERNEIGFFTVLSIEPLHECLEAHGLLPDYQKIDI